MSIKNHFLLIILMISAGLSYAQTITRGPYLQTGTTTSITIKWRTNVATDSKVWYGSSVGNLNNSVQLVGSRTDHELTISGLNPATNYFYAVGNIAGQIVGDDANHFFETSPVNGSTDPLSFWILGDCGTANANQRAVRDAFYNYNGSNYINGIIMLGDNAYSDGTDAQYQNGVFNNMYEDVLIKSPLWSCQGNHEFYNGGTSSSTQTGPYYDIFTFPTNAEAGGLASSTEAYYSFDVGNVHFISLDSYDSDRSIGGTMLTWLENDLAATSQDWIVVYFHHPPYTKGSHDSDNQGDSGGRMHDMRENALPILENYGVDLVLGGHSHVYERSFQINGHYGESNTWNAATMLVDGGDGKTDGDGAYLKNLGGGTDGTVYVTTGSAGQATGSGSLNHPAHYYSVKTLGSTVLEVDDNELNLKFLNSNGVVEDYLTINKVDLGTPPTVAISNPSSGQLFENLNAINLQANASDVDGNIQSVEFFVNGVSVAVDNSSPFGYSWTPPAYGNYQAYAEVTDNSTLTSLSTTISFTVNAQGNTLTSSTIISSGADDVEENENNGFVYSNSSDIELVYDTYQDNGVSQDNQTIGLRFNQVSIPQGANITNAYIQFTADEANSGTTNLTIVGEDIDNAPGFASSPYNVSNRTKTNANVNWSPVAWNTVNERGVDQRTPDLSSIVQEIVNRPGYALNNSIAIIIDGTGERTAEAFDGVPSAAAELIVSYSTSACPPAGTPCNDGVPSTINDIEDGNCNCTGTSSSTTFEVRVATGNDDVEENENDGYMYFSSSDLEIVDDAYAPSGHPSQGNQTIGLRFNNIDVPQGATITNAYLEFTTDEAKSGSANLNIDIENVDDANAFSSATYNVSGRSLSGNAVSWSPAAWNIVGESGASQQTSDLSNIVQLVVNRGGWSSNNSMVFVITGSGVRTAEAYNGSAAQAPLLHIEYGSSCIDSDEDGICNDQDGCPNDANKTTAGDCGCGNPDTDTDGDGTADCNDGCPNDASKITPGPCGCGENDSDGDLVCTPTDCNDNDPLIYPGASCDDGDANTTNDVYDASCNCLGTSSSATIEVQINDGYDDVEQNENDGYMYFWSSDLEISEDTYAPDGHPVQGNQTIGLRFNDISVPQGASITNAYIQFTTDESKSGSASLNIDIENSDNANAFTTTAYNLTERSFTGNEVSWNPGAWNTVGEAGTNQRTSDLSGLIQTVVSRGGWSTNNSMVFVLSGNGVRTAEAYNGSAAQAPILHIEYGSSCPDGDGDGTCDAEDGCPNDANKTEPGPCGCGESDSDGDLVCTPTDCNDNDPSVYPGASCDDGNSGTTNDVYDNACNCIGTPVSGVLIESATVSGVGDTWQTINLNNSYSSMVVVATPVLPASEPAPVVTRIRNAVGNAFELRIQVPAGTAATNYDVHYVVVEEGAYSVANDGIKMEAVKFNSTVTARSNSWQFEDHSYINSYSNPVVLGQVMSYNDAGWSVFWASRDGSRANPPSNISTFSCGKNVGEDPDNTRANETIGYIVLESGAGSVSGLNYESGVGADIVMGPQNTSVGYDYDLSSITSADVAILSTAAIDGANGGFPELYGNNPVSGSTITLVFDEDQANDNERSHTHEQVAYLVFGSLDARLSSSDLKDNNDLEQKILIDEFNAVLFPNPTTGKVYVKFNIPLEKELDVLVYDLNGAEQIRTTAKEGLNQLSIDLSELPKGIYLIQLRGDKLMKSYRVMTMD